MYCFFFAFVNLSKAVQFSLFIKTLVYRNIVVYRNIALPLAFLIHGLAQRAFDFVVVNILNVLKVTLSWLRWVEFHKEENDETKKSMGI